jgi:GNAT superfamily N-acetyltransferase
MNVKIVKRLPTPEEYNALRRSVEWPTYDSLVAELALANSLYGVVAATDDGTIAGMGRIIGDNAIYLHIQDVIVNPRFQKLGIGKLIMEALLSYINSVATTNTNVGLMSSKGRENFYKEFGFIERPNEKFGSGMIKVIS